MKYQNSEHTFTCYSYKAYAETAMLYRQTGTSKKLTMSIFKKTAKKINLNEDHKKLFFDLVHRAYELPISKNWHTQEKIIADYGNVVFSNCVKMEITPV